MSSEVALALAGLCLTYLLRSAAAYLLLWLLCRLVPDPHIRFRLCGIFLGGMVGGWLGLFLLPGLSALSRSEAVAFASASGPHWSWTVNSALVPRLATVLSGAPWLYLALLCFLMLQFFFRFRRLRVLLRSSQPPSEALSFLFESVRCDTGAPQCELRLVHGLRSPAATAWWDPKILLPSELLPRLETQQLVDVLKHELIHVRRRDYLWDRLATLGCYVVFFHPAAWLVRRRLRWERELVCDEGVVEGSGVRRLEYATCLTTLASGWWLPEEEFAGPIDFFSSPSLLAVRVHSLVLPGGGEYSARKKAALGLLATTALAVAVSVAPEVAVTSAWSVPRDAARIQEPPAQPQPILKTERPGMPRGHKRLVIAAIAPDEYSRFTRVAQIQSSSSVLPSPYDAQSHRSSGHHSMQWGLMRKVGTWTVHTVKFGVTKLGSIGGSNRQSQSSGQLPRPAPENS